MRKIIFWNVEGASVNAIREADRLARRKDMVARTMKMVASRHSGHDRTGPLTRGTIDRVRRSLKSHGLTREQISEARAHMAAERAALDAQKMRNKFKLFLDLPHSAHDVFCCEVVANHPHARSPLAGAAAAGGATKCYAYYHNAASTAFTHCPVTSAWYAGPAFAPGVRVPKAVVLAATAGNVLCCFWHAPSGNNGAIVAQVFNGLVGAGPFVLFGDLNAEPKQLIQQGVPAADIIAPHGMTRISGRCLDYAITNVPNQVSACRAIYPDQYRDIKQKTGSDHMAMVLQLV